MFRPALDDRPDFPRGSIQPFNNGGPARGGPVAFAISVVPFPAGCRTQDGQSEGRHWKPGLAVRQAGITLKVLSNQPGAAQQVGLRPSILDRQPDGGTITTALRWSNLRAALHPLGLESLPNLG